MERVHIVFMVSDMQTYQEWFSLFPGLESKCDVMFLDDLTKDGYRSLARAFLERTNLDEDIEEDEKSSLVESLVHIKEIVKGKVFDLFYSQDALRYYVHDDFLNGHGAETLYPSERKVHFSLLEDGNFKVQDPLLK